MFKKFVLTVTLTTANCQLFPTLKRFVDDHLPVRLVRTSHIGHFTDWQTHDDRFLDGHYRGFDPQVPHGRCRFGRQSIGRR